MDKLSTWDKIKLKLRFQEPETDTEYRYVMSKYDKPYIPTSVLKDAYKGAKIRYNNSYDDLISLSDFLDTAMKNRLAGKDVPQRGISYSPTGADMFDLWNPPLQVPEYSAMPDLWSNKKAQ